MPMTRPLITAAILIAAFGSPAEPPVRPAQPEALVVPPMPASGVAYALEPRTDAGGPAYRHEGANWRPSSEGRIELLRTGELAYEPTLGFTDDHTLLYQGIDRATTPMHSGSALYRTRDVGRTWTRIMPPGVENSQTADPYLFVDPTSSRAYSVNYLFPTCSSIAWTDDGGDTWDDSVGGCTLLDHQNLFTGPPVSSHPEGYPNVVYYCAITLGFGPFSHATGCEKSLDGGRTFLPTGGLPFHSDPRRGGDPLFDVPGWCTGAIGHGATDHRGTIYLPAGQCGQPWLAISDDEGTTWRHVQVATNGMALADEGIGDDCFETGVGPVDEGGGTILCSGERTWAGHEVRVAVDALGHVYATWIAADHRVYLAVMRAGSDVFDPPVRVSPPNVRGASLPAIDVGDPGGVAIAYIGSENMPAPRHCAGNAVTECDLEGGSTGEYHAGTTWNGYVTVTKHGLKAQPEFLTVTANPLDDPLERGFCGQVRCGDLGDFFDVVVGPDGRAWAAFADACLPDIQPDCAGPLFEAAEGVVAHLVDGPRLRK